MKNADYMALAIEEAYEGIKAGHGGPFGSVIVKNGEIIAKGHNEVLHKHDASCHGEISAIRAAGERLKSHDLSGCVIYTTGEPCPMCLCACMWANIDKIYYGATIKDNELIGFRDDKFNDAFGTDRSSFADYLVEESREECLKLFKDYNKMSAERY